MPSLHAPIAEYLPDTVVRRLEKRLRANVTRKIDPDAKKSSRKDIDAGRYPGRCKWRKIDHIVTYAASIAVRGRTLVLRVDGERWSLVAPAGWRWKIEDGRAVLFLAAAPDCDLHLRGRDFERPIADLVAEASRNYAARLRHAATEAANAQEQQLLDECMDRVARLCKVTLGDSASAGNCLAGTIDFAQRAGVEAPNCYSGLPADVLLRVGGRAALAARQAIRRQTEICI